jgi:hypothetical protein
MPSGSYLVRVDREHEDDPRDQAWQDRAFAIDVSHLGMTRPTLHLLEILAS